MTNNATGQTITERLQDAKKLRPHTNELIGIARGLLADGMLNQSEAEYLLKWLEERPGALDTWPYNVLFQRLSESLADGRLDSNEEAELLGMLVDLTGGGKLEGAATVSTTALPLNDPQPNIEFDGRTFVVTGTFVSGTREEVKADITIRGGRVLGAVSRKTDYVVLGQQASDQWTHANYGSKLEKALMLRDDGHPIAIISEKHWASFLD
ncbi:BRCT domain-containing protein [Chromohalobacter nigrandesensis]|uniref:BRCT domain-containing protein n=1 Tax=Chromohalobacter nigrandesensis TaxID=119863 RepID=UPI001FF2D7F0|nr:BRCT domain-containing protein [Chromohalobacter nigrandesensis]MCK0743592.1 BRCT domain-containing protein [Chromohalobacter nigrandesensis]